MSALIDNMEWISKILKDHPELTAWRVTAIDGLVSAEVTGGYEAAHAWKEALGGRIFPSTTNAAGVRSQHIAGHRFTVDVVCQTGVTRTGAPVVSRYQHDPIHDPRD